MKGEGNSPFWPFRAFWTISTVLWLEDLATGAHISLPSRAGVYAGRAVDPVGIYLGTLGSMARLPSRSRPPTLCLHRKETLAARRPLHLL